MKEKGMKGQKVKISECLSKSVISQKKICIPIFFILVEVFTILKIRNNNGVSSIKNF